MENNLAYRNCETRRCQITRWSRWLEQEGWKMIKVVYVRGGKIGEQVMSTFFDSIVWYYDKYIHFVMFTI